MNTCPECNRFIGNAGHSSTCSKRGLSPLTPDYLLALKIRNLIAAREFNVATASRELQCGDGWLFDHGQCDRELAEEIEELFKLANAQAKETT